jgi:hypothetical protein
LLLSRSGATIPGVDLIVLDVSNPIKPIQLCTLSPASGGRFISETTIAFWSGRELGSADLASGVVAGTAKLTSVPSDGAFSADGSLFAYHVGGDTNGMSTHLYSGSIDRILLTRPGIGGHGAPVFGPSTELSFSPDSRYLLAVDSLYANFESGPPNFLVYRTNGSLAFQSATAAFGAWAPTGSELYYLAPTQQGEIAGTVHSWNSSGGGVIRGQVLAAYVWPVVAPDGLSLVFNSYDSSGLPHLWRLDLRTGAVGQVSTAISSRAVFVGAGVVWSGKEQPCSCGIGGVSAPTGKVVSHDLQNGHEAFVDLTWWLDPLSNPVSDGALLDVWTH